MSKSGPITTGDVHFEGGQALATPQDQKPWVFGHGGIGRATRTSSKSLKKTTHHNHS
jgi:hypothetical protein